MILFYYTRKEKIRIGLMSHQMFESTKRGVARVTAIHRVQSDNQPT